MTTEEIKDELYRMLSDVMNGGYPKRTYAQQARYKEAVKRTVDALDVLEQMSHSEKPNEWISTSESMPPIGQDVLVCDLDGDMYITYLHLNGTWGFDYCGNKIKSVVAWQELPAPFKPQERDNESCDEIWEKVYAERDGKTHFNTTEVKIYGQPNEDCISRKAVFEGLANIAKAKAKSDAQKSLMGRVMFFTEHLPSVTPQPKEHTEERTETHACDYISRKAVLDSLHSCFTEGFNEDRWWNSTHVLDAINEVPSIQPQPKEDPQQKTGHWIEHKNGEIEHIECSECRCWFLRKDLIRNSYCPNCGSRNHWEWELKMQEVKK